MKKFALLVLLFVCLSHYQEIYPQMRLSVQPGLQIPIGDFSNTAAVGFGVGTTVEFLKRQKKGIDWSFTGSAGFYYFAGSKDLPSGTDFSYQDIPIQVGLRYYIGKSDIRTYIGAELGVHLLTITQTIPAGEFQASDTFFGFAPLIGFKFYFTRSLDMDINIKLNSISSEGSTLSFVGFNFGLDFALN